jgi:predicted DNA binding CopG/RHH family protein
MSLKDAMAKKKSRTSTQKEAAIQEVTKEPMKRLNVNIAESKLMQFKAKSASEGKDMSTLIHQWVDEYLSK